MPHPYSISSVQFSHSVVSDSLWPHGLQHARPPYPSPTPGVYSNPCPLSRWCHPTISSSVIPFSSCPQSFPASGSFQMSQFFSSCGQSIGFSASASVLPMTIQDRFPLGWTGWISLLSEEFSRVFSNTIVQKHQFFVLLFFVFPNPSLVSWSSDNTCLPAYIRCVSMTWLPLASGDWITYFILKHPLKWDQTLYL